MRNALLISIFSLVLITGCSTLVNVSATPAAASPTPPIPTTSPTVTSTNTATSTPTSTPTATSTSTPTPTPTSTPLGGTGAFVYSGSINLVPGQGINPETFLFDLDTKTSTLLAWKEYQLIGISPAREDLLLAKGNALIAMNIHSGVMVELANNLLDRSKSAVWYENDQIVFIGWEDQSRFLYKTRPEGGEPEKMTVKGMRPVKLFPSDGLEGIYWASGSITISTKGTSTNIQSHWRSAWDGSAPVELKIEYPNISPREPLFAYFKDDDYIGTNLRLVIENLQNSEQVTISEKFSEKHYARGQIFWSPSGQQLLAQAPICVSTSSRSWSCGTASDFYIFSKDGKFIKKLILPEMLNWINEFEWSPDDQWLLFENIVQPGRMHNKYLYNLKNDELIDLSAYFPEGLVFWRYFWVEWE